MDYIKLFLDVAPWIVTISAGISAALPNKNKRGERVFKTLNKILNVLAFNYANAKNKEQ